MSIDLLRSVFSFTCMPFGKDLPPSALHRHRGHEEAVARIAYCIAERAIGVLTGECGSGKTVAARAALAGLEPSRHTTIYLGSPGVGLRGIYAGIVSGLGGTPRFHTASLVPQVAELIATEAAERAKTVVLVLDESHLLSAETLEGLRCLRNDNMDAESLFSLI
ncbi:MAG: AAA family ATPase, partial [Acidimicrobiales bacterium]